MKNKKIIIGILLLLIIIAGILTIVFAGFKFDLYYGASKTISINIGKEFNSEEIKELAKEVFGKEKVIVQKEEMFKDIVAITVKEINDEQIEQLQQKINGKYGLELDLTQENVDYNSHIRGRDIIKPYISPILMATLFVAIYIVVRTRNLWSAIKYVLILGITVLLYASIIAITRIPVNIYVVPVGLVLFILITLIYFNILEKNLKNKSED